MDYQEIEVVKKHQFANFTVETLFISNNYYDYEVSIRLHNNIYKKYYHQTRNLKDALDMHNYYIDLIKKNQL